MATRDITAQHGGAPVACALTPADLAAQATRWRQLAAQAMTERTETGYGLRITFRRGPGVADELARLAAVENQCCPWATWTVETGTQRTVLDVRSTGDGITTLHTMFTGLDPGPAAPCC
jgi:MerR family copper efflux transcriptional regulator